MKYGIRTPSFKKSFKAKTSGRINRTIKKSLDPTYGKKGMGLIKDPEKAVYNKIYNKTSKSIFDSNPQHKETLIEKFASSDIDGKILNTISGGDEKKKSILKKVLRIIAIIVGLIVLIIGVFAELPSLIICGIILLICQHYLKK